MAASLMGWLKAWLEPDAGEGNKAPREGENAASESDARFAPWSGGTSRKDRTAAASPADTRDLAAAVRREIHRKRISGLDS